MTQAVAEQRGGYRPPDPVELPPLYGLSPAVTHSDFDQLALGRRARVTVAYLFHHRHFEVNYGNTPSPIDALAGTWHDGTDEAQEALRHRRRTDQT